MTQPTTFEIGKRYSCRSACDYECVWTFEVVGRTATGVRIRDVDEAKPPRLRKIRVWYGVESCMPMGSYSMAPILSADRLAA